MHLISIEANLRNLLYYTSNNNKVNIKIIHKIITHSS